MNEYGGKLPSCKSTIKTSGNRTYTAGAVASIAYQIPVPAIDGNVMRVMTRFVEEKGNILDIKTRNLSKKNL